MNEHYRHTQIGYMIIAALSLPVILVVLHMYIFGFNLFSIIVLILFNIILVLFVSMTTYVDEEFVKIKFGLGVVRKRFPLKDIVSCRIVENPWYYGFGIQNTPSGLLFSVSGTDAVEIKINTGQTFRIGTDEPQELEKAINEALGRKR